MTQGVKTFGGAKKVTKQFDPIPKGVYDFILDTSKARLQNPENGGVEFINGVQLKWANPTEGWKGSKGIYLNWLSLQTNLGEDPATEFVMTDDGLFGLGQALGDDIRELGWPMAEKEYDKTKKNKDNSTEQVHLKTLVIDGMAVLEYLKANDGKQVRAEVKVVEETYKGEKQNKNRVVKYVYPEQE